VLLLVQAGVVCVWVCVRVYACVCTDRRAQPKSVIQALSWSSRRMLRLMGRGRGGEGEMNGEEEGKREW
jgi:hypothetical protein